MQKIDFILCMCLFFCIILAREKIFYMTRIWESVAEYIENNHDEILKMKISTDTRQINPGDFFFPLKGPNNNGYDYIQDALDKKCTAIFVDFDWWEGGKYKQNKQFIVIKNFSALKALHDFAQYKRQYYKGNIIAITGSVGKTSCKTWLKEILSQQCSVYASPKSFNNDIGVPWSMMNASLGDSVWILEVGTNNPGEIEYLAKLIAPDIGIITSICEVHSAGFDNFDAIIAEKISLLPHVRQACFLYKDIDVSKINLSVPVFLFPGLYSWERKNQDEISILRNEMCLFDIKISEEHKMWHPSGLMYYLSLFASVFEFLKLNVKKACQDAVDILSFCEGRGLHIKLQWKNCTIVDDSYNASPISVYTNLQHLNSRAEKNKQVLWVVLGGLGELKDPIKTHIEVGKFFSCLSNVQGVWLLGRTKGYLDAVYNNLRDEQKKSVYDFTETDALCENLMNCVGEGDVIWVKGSRYESELDRVVKILIKKC